MFRHKTRLYSIQTGLTSCRIKSYLSIYSLKGRLHVTIVQTYPQYQPSNVNFHHYIYIYIHPNMANKALPLVRIR